MDGNLRAEPARDFVSMERNVDESRVDLDIYRAKGAPRPQRTYCPIESRTMCQSGDMWWPVRCSREEYEDSWTRVPSLDSLGEEEEDDDGDDDDDDEYEETSSAEIRYGHCEYKGTFFADPAYQQIDDAGDKNWGCVGGNPDKDPGQVKARRRGRSAVKGRVGRNARERRRVMAVSGAFLRLRKAVPQAANSAAPARRLSKLKTLRGAIVYIKELQRLLNAISYHPMCNSFSGTY